MKAMVAEGSIFSRWLMIEGSTEGRREGQDREREED